MIVAILKYLLNCFFVTGSSELYSFSIAHLFIFRFSEVFFKSSTCNDMSLSNISSAIILLRINFM